MVEIRTLKPTVRLKMPSKPRPKKGPSYKITVRYNRDYPPPTPQPTPCRLWQGVEGTDGYGRRKIHIPGQPVRSTSMHRWVMEQLLERRLEPSEVVLHACDNRLCYRADHLSIGTVQDNNRDMLNKGRASKPPVNRFYGECHPMAKLSAAQVREIRGHRQSGLLPRTIATMYDVSPSTIRRICQGVTWNYVGDKPPSHLKLDRFIKPPTRDLLAEARARLDAEAAAAEAAAKAAWPLGDKIRPVRPIKKEP